MLSSREASVDIASGGKNAAEREVYGVWDYRSVEQWMFAARVLLKPKRRAKMTIGTLHVKVVQARGLMARDGLLGRSDPYAKLEVTGRYPATGQEWSEDLRIHERTKTIKYSLNPVWNEEFSLPVRRSGAILRVHLWDWDPGVDDDPLGSFEVKLDDELLSQKKTDKWYVLEAPSDFKMLESIMSHVRADLDPEMPAPSEAEEDTKETGAEAMEANLKPDEHHAVHAHKWKSVLGKTGSAGGRHTLIHDHGPGHESLTCEACIEERRKQFGEVRLELRYEFNEFAETCSHIWPEEPPKPPEGPFSPNRIFYNAMLLGKLAWPYCCCCERSVAIMQWVHPWQSLLCAAALVTMLLHPCFLIVVAHGFALWVVIAAYMNHVISQIDEREGADSGDVGSGFAARSIKVWQTWATSKPPKILRNSLPKKSVLLPIDAPEDVELQEMYQTVRSTNKLPAIVEDIGSKKFAESGVPIQQQVELFAKLLMDIRRIFHPMNLGPCVLMVGVLTGHALLQLWFYLSSRFHVYLALAVVVIFACNFGAWRGRAFVLGVREAVRCRNVRITQSTATSTVDGNNTTPCAPSRSDPSPRDISLDADGQEFSSRGVASPTDEPVPPSVISAAHGPQTFIERGIADVVRSARSHSAGAASASPRHAQETDRRGVVSGGLHGASSADLPRPVGKHDGFLARKKSAGRSDEGRGAGKETSHGWRLHGGGASLKAVARTVLPHRGASHSKGGGLLHGWHHRASVEGSHSKRGWFHRPSARGPENSTGSEALSTLTTPIASLPDPRQNYGSTAGTSTISAEGPLLGDVLQGEEEEKGEAPRAAH